MKLAGGTGEKRIEITVRDSMGWLTRWGQGRTQVMTSLTESRGPDPWGGPGALKRGPGGPREERKEKRKREEKRKKEEKKKQIDLDCSFVIYS